MKFILVVLQVVISVFMIGLILLQQKGGGLSPVFGGGGGVYRTRRGVERIIFWLTIILGTLFLLSASITILIT